MKRDAILNCFFCKDYWFYFYQFAAFFNCRQILTHFLTSSKTITKVIKKNLIDGKYFAVSTGLIKAFLF
jgi:hypothetical protein